MSKKFEPWFPVPDIGNQAMSLKQYYAGQALAGLMANDSESILRIMSGKNKSEAEGYAESLAVFLCAMAEALAKEVNCENS